ncbi:MAG: hypothetical protein PWP15_1481 [Methanothermococcus sp.]|uniref:chorismate pyruvate-lyase family protein n=1 Tax=Methanothermococcus TaxID=155862 RepID=UPI00037D4AD0|nr:MULTISPECIES: chorismate pyruvate-lyase family protein [Methanothermococcus]MDK2790972.1 hypothetical protein [Methanothermococcus sp.]MDK2988205.1 hypothetical protein [Methanothermococcus sp.]
MVEKRLKPYVVIKELSRKHGLKNEEKILLGTDGSITNLLEILFECEVVVKTIYQEIMDDINHRTVVLEVEGIPLIYAVSKIPLKNIEEDHIREGIKRDLLSADIPIGKILKIHNLETRREIVNIDVKEITEEVQVLLKTNKKILPQRTYNIIHKNKVLMEITEVFNVRDYI